MVFAAMLIMVGAAVKGAGWKAADSVSYTFGRLWGISILAEYDICLKERYGILGFWGNEASVAQKLDMYADYSFSEKDYITLGKVPAPIPLAAFRSSKGHQNVTG